MKTMIKEAAILFLITLVSGCLLGAVYSVTKTPIAEAKQRAKEAACKEVFADADSFALKEDLDLAAGNTYLSEQGYKVEINEVSEAVSADGSVLGYVITLTDSEGYGGDIQFSMGVRNDGTINAISFLSISETAGLGMKADP
ncbi:MAG: FMN-binding protein, partial [Lachnospiraceae bacterium]|nr:FMN-binding protein [Lachnospiraceae bacterium]